MDYLETSGAGDDACGYAIPVGSSAQLDPLPWFNVDTITIQFSQHVIVEKADLSLWGVTFPQYAFAADPAGFSYDEVNRVATWTLSQAISQPDKLLIDLDGSSAGVDGVRHFL